ncbi:CPLD39 [Auxenochlorella protothecoides x Auxenochlorella symbiontica]
MSVSCRAVTQGWSVPGASAHRAGTRHARPFAAHAPPCTDQRLRRRPAACQAERPDSGWVEPAAGPSLPSQGEMVVTGTPESIGRQLQEILRPPPDTDYLAEFLAIQNNGPRKLGFFGTRNMGFMHQQLIEVLAYAMILTGNHIYTSGATGTNAAVIRGALRAENPELLTVVLPQSLTKQPLESQELLQQVPQLIEMPQNDDMQLSEASRLCNRDIIGRVAQIICFAFHDSGLLLETCQEAKAEKKIVTMFFLD